jgi:mono/diheme cytochrome c family protein
MRKWTGLGLGLAVTLFASALAFPAGAQGDGGKALLEQKCSICHSADRPKAKKKDRAGWEKTVMRMKNVNGCPITDEEAKTIIDYLAKNYGP